MSAVAAPADLVVENGRVLSIEGGRTRLVAADVVIAGGRVRALVPRGACSMSATPPGGRTRLDACGCIVMPGLVNAHTHSPEMLARGRAERARFGDWMAAVWADLDTLSPERARLAVLLGAAEMIATGVTGVVDHLRRFPMTEAVLEAVVNAYADTGMVACVPVMLRDAADANGRMVDAPHLSALPSAERQIALVRETTAFAARRGVRLGLGPSAPHRCSDDLLELVFGAAVRDGLPVHTHVDETADIAAAARRRFGRSTIAHLAASGLLTPTTALAHCVGIGARDAERIAAGGAVVVHNPVANMRLGSGICPVPDLMRAGAAIALGTDGAAGNDGQNLRESLKLAALLPRRPDIDPDDWPTCAAVLDMATSAGQRVLREPAEHALAGRIVPGAPADLAIFDDDPDGDPESADEATVAARLVLGNTGRRARHVVAGGRVLLEDGRSTTIDLDAIRAALGDARTRARQETCA